MMILGDPGSALRACIWISSLGVFLASAEWLASPLMLDGNGLHGWTLNRLRHPWLCRPPLEPLLEPLLGTRGVSWNLRMRLLTSATLVVSAPWASAGAIAVLCAVVAVSSTAMLLRSTYGHDGADQLVVVVNAAAAMGFWVDSQVSLLAAALFIALQAVLAYATAGVAKLASREWRQDDLLPEIVSTTIYGHEATARFLHAHPRLSRALARAVIAFECAFPLVLLGQPVVTVLLLAIATTFHLGNLVVMRLSSFLWAFAATYPAVAYCFASAARG